jgi:hypothetical protein
MTERDVFESRLHAALVRHVANGPTDFDALAFARTVAGKEPRRRGLAASLAWRGLAFPRRAWALLLLAGLFAAMVAGTLLVGSQHERKLPAVVPPVAPSVAQSIPPAFVCPVGTNPDKPGPVDQARPVIGDGSAGMVFDRHAGRIVLLAQVDPGPETWTFDVCTNTWTRMHPDQEPGDPWFFTHLIYDVDSDATIAIDGASTWVYNLAADTWTRMRAAPIVRQWKTLTWTYDPVSGLVFAADTSELWSYDVETDTWALISAAPWTAGKASLAYDASVDRIVAYADSRDMWLFDIRTGTWSKSGADTPEVVCIMGWPNPGVVYDEVAERTVVSCNISVAYHATADRWESLAYDATADRWESLANDAGPFAVYDALNERFIGLGEDRDSVLAFDLATRERIVLLEPAPRVAFACPPGSTPDTPGPVDQERPARNASAAIAFDRRAGRIVLLAPSAGAAAETWTFDVCSNVYARMRPAQEPVLLGASHLVYDDDAGVTIATDGRTTWAYDLGANTWHEMGSPPAAADPAAPSMAFDPVSGVVIGAFGRELWSYDVETDLWTLVSGAPWPGSAVLAYDASVDRIVAEAGSETWLYAIRSGTWSRGADTTFCAWGMGMVLPAVIVYDEAAKRTVVSCGARAAYDATAGRWEFMTDIPGSFPSSMAFDVANGRLVGIGEIQDGVFAFDLETREQIILLEPVRGQATP